MTLLRLSLWSTGMTVAKLREVATTMPTIPWGEMTAMSGSTPWSEPLFIMM